MNDSVLEVGKLPPKLLAEVLVTGRPGRCRPSFCCRRRSARTPASSPCAAEALIAASDPVTLTGQDVGAHAVLVNANDIAVTGAKPRWFTATVLLPPGITEADSSRALEVPADARARWRHWTAVVVNSLVICTRRRRRHRGE